MNATPRPPRRSASARATASADADQPQFTVGSVAARLHVPIATLRSWNHRYSIGPSTHRRGRHRLYSETDIAVIRHMRDLIDRGAAPGAAARSAMDAISPGRTDPHALVAAAFELDTDRAARLVDASLRADGVLDTWNDVIRPALRAIEAQQADGRSCIDVEHALSWTVIRSLQRIRVATPGASGAPTILACTATEMHTMPLEALRAALAERAQAAVMLGAHVPPIALSDAVERSPRRSTVVLWAQTTHTADPQATHHVAAQSRILLGGPGWPATQPRRRGRRVASLAAAIEWVTRSA